MDIVLHNQANYFASDELGKAMGDAVQKKIGLRKSHHVHLIVYRAFLGDDLSRAIVASCYGDVDWIEVCGLKDSITPKSISQKFSG
jgi:hypothetical protein